MHETKNLLLKTRKKIPNAALQTTAAALVVAAPQARSVVVSGHDHSCRCFPQRLCSPATRSSLALGSREELVWRALGLG